MLPIQLIQSIILVAVLVALRWLIGNSITTWARKVRINPRRQRIVLKFLNFVTLSSAILALVVIWGVDRREFQLLVSSVFAVMGIALFAQWSVLSNVTSGLIMFFSFPYRIGDRVRILDLEFAQEGTIEDITAFCIKLRLPNGRQLTYPNNIVLQKGVEKL